MRLRWWRREIICQQWVELVTDYLEGALSPRLTRAIEHHLADCEHCTEYLEQVRATIRLTGQLRAEDVPDELLDVLAAAYAEEFPPRQ